jgi:hypothetical protein
MHEVRRRAARGKPSALDAVTACLMLGDEEKADY